MEEKFDEFLDKTLDLFVENGAKALTMDDIAKTFSISKKTLYEQYGSKESLLETVLSYKLDKVIKSVKKIDEQSSNAIEAILNKDESISESIQQNRSIFIKQLMKYYPVIFDKHMLDCSDKITELIIKNIHKGREQGIFRKDFNEWSYSKFFFQLIMSYETTPFINTEKISKSDYHDEVIMFYLHAITTEKGKQILNDYNESK